MDTKYGGIKRYITEKKRKRIEIHRHRQQCDGFQKKRRWGGELKVEEVKCLLSEGEVTLVGAHTMQ